MDEKNRLLQEDESEFHGVSISAVDILQQKFAVKFRGYDVQDVDSFLEVVAKEMERLTNDNAGMNEEIIVLKRDLTLYKKKEESINAALVTVQKMAEDLKNKAEAESEQMLSDAKREAETILVEAQQKSTAVHEEIDILKGRAEHGAQKVVDDVRLEANRIKEEMMLEQSKLQEQLNTLTQKKRQFHISLKALIETHLRLLESEKE
jgi:cell division initiation protein